MPRGSDRAAPQDGDPYFKKTIDLRYRRHSLRFRASQSLFSSHEIDRGTRLLLRTLDTLDLTASSKILDLGCGYGVIGIALGSASGAHVHLVDRDELAVQYARDNAKLNGLGGATAYGSLGFDDVTDTDFDLIVSNLPGKAGEDVLAALLSDARHFLKPGGTVAVVVVSALSEIIEPILLDSLGAVLSLRTVDRGYTVFHFAFQESTIVQGEFRHEFERGVYDRGEALLPMERTELRIETARGLPEFDTLSYQTELLIETLGGLDKGEVGRAVVVNSGQGHIAVAVHHIFSPDAVTLVGRDLLALRYSRKNLILNGCQTSLINTLHASGPGGVGMKSSDLTVISLDGDEPPNVPGFLLREGLHTLSVGGMLIVGGSSTAVTRLEKAVRSQKTCRIISRKRRRGSSVLVLGNE